MTQDPQHRDEITVSDLLWDDEFRNWSISPTPVSDKHWNKWLKENPQYQAILLEAKNLIAALIIREPAISAAEMDTRIVQIVSDLNESSAVDLAKTGLISGMFRLSWQRGVAASLIILLGFGIVRYAQSLRSAPVLYQEIVRKSGTDLIEKINLANEPETVILADGTKVTLVKNSRMSYAADFNRGEIREIFLSGTASFDVAKDPSRPLLVYTNGLITKVLGTKFIIHSMDNDRKVSVEVISGIVSVYSFIDKPSGIEKESKKLNALILTANQKANYSGEDKTLMATIVADPAIVAPKTYNFTFESTPVDSVFKSIGIAYGIEIIYDEISLARRSFTATLTSGSMYEKLDIVCKTLNARYEVIDGKIVVYDDARKQ